MLGSIPKICDGLLIMAGSQMCKCDVGHRAHQLTRDSGLFSVGGGGSPRGSFPSRLDRMRDLVTTVSSLYLLNNATMVSDETCNLSLLSRRSAGTENA